MKIPAHAIFKRLTPGLILGFVVFIGLGILGDIREVSKSLLAFQWRFFAFAVALTLLNYVLRFFKWHYYLGQVGVRGLSWAHSLRLFVGGFPLAVTPGKVGEALKGIWLNRMCGLPVGRGISVVLAERISDGIAVLLLSTLGVVAYPQYWPAFAVILGVLLLMVIISQIRPAALFLLSFGERLPLINRMMRGLHEFYEGSFMLFRPGAFLIAVLIGTVSWLAEGVGFYMILLGLGLSPSLQLLSSAVFILAFSTAVGAASALPGGLGAAEVSIAGMLALILKIDPAIATSATFLIRLATLWFGVGLGLLVWTISPELLSFHSEQVSITEA